MNYKVMEMLDKGEKPDTFGHPQINNRGQNIKKGHCIFVSGHDLHDLEKILHKPKARASTFTLNGEMLPAHAYPELNKYPHLRVTTAALGRTSKKNSLTSWRNCNDV